MSGDPDQLLTARQASDLCGVSSSTLNRWASARELGMDSIGPVHIQLSERTRVWRRGDVLDWLRDRRRAGGAA
ncbi:helix-turn-helix transcriptional regulator [Jongsikchunia kroppenstedtii]|uniref:helix-turn-helix transcriptional regulator n=1 Tax=Jongsikchunia kroppenstedtii TaxID=1121721 RepID=UPI003F846B1B